MALPFFREVPTVDRFTEYRFDASAYPGVAQLVARLTGGQEAVSSSLATRTKKER